MAYINESRDTMWTEWFATSFPFFPFDVSSRLLTPEVAIKAYVRTPSFTSESAAPFSGLTTIGDLANLPEWVEARCSAEFRSAGVLQSAYLKKEAGDDDPVSLVTLFDTGDPEPVFVRRYVEDDAGWYFTAVDPVEEIITAVVFYIDGPVTTDDGSGPVSTTNPILFATTRGCGTNTVVHDNSLYGVAQSYVGLNAEADLLTVSNSSSTFAARHCLLSPGLPPWESAHSQHLWIEPQRANLIANPAFQDSSLFGWRTPDDTSMQQVTGGVSSWRDTPKCGRLYGVNPSKKLESNFFPNVSEWYSGSFSVSASNGCSIRYGLVAFDPTYTNPRYLVSDYLSINTPTPGSASKGFFRVTFLTKMFLDAVDICFRLEIENADEVWVSDVLIDPHPGQYDYFDGACTLGSPGDFRWMGSEDDRHFSLWYNNYRNTRNRVIGGYDASDGRYKPGLVEEWAPTGATIVAHWDAITPITPQNWSGDAYHTLSDVHGSEPTVVSSEYKFDLSPRRASGDIPYVLDSDPDNPSRPVLDEDDSVLL